MQFAIIMFGLICLFLLFRLFQYRQQLKLINQQLQFIQQHDSNLLLTKQLNSKQLNKLLSLLNQMLILQRQQKIAFKQQDQQLKDSITNLAHDIRTPLTSLDGYFQLLIKNQEPAKQEQYIAIIENRIQALNELLETIFTYTKLQNNAYEIQLAKTQLNQTLYDALFNFYQATSNEKLEPEVFITEEPIFVLANTAALNRVFFNLLKNSLDHGKGDLKISLIKQQNHAVIKIQNKIDAEDEIDQTQIFNQFYMSDQSRTGNSTGLGLYIVKEFLERMNSQIEAEVSNQLFIVSLVFPIIH
ncbi:sensor histidine kinase [Isobaculum melis]|uniref:histidine kinase n=1 Tax=Isobaculum melis TaxID=142588 RepID=A0A1H9TUD1_9LACT|nr:HAMP domain-containing sensor histidine kinase [Isobaculum melis]SES00598.1 Signal transduction histidine kinase [Isobaculum melis]